MCTVRFNRRYNEAERQNYDAVRCRLQWVCCMFLAGDNWIWSSTGVTTRVPISRNALREKHREVFQEETGLISIGHDGDYQEAEGRLPDEIAKCESEILQEDHGRLNSSVAHCFVRRCLELGPDQSGLCVATHLPIFPWPAREMATARLASSTPPQLGAGYAVAIEIMRLLTLVSDRKPVTVGTPISQRSLIQILPPTAAPASTHRTFRKLELLEHSLKRIGPFQLRHSGGAPAVPCLSRRPASMRDMLPFGYRICTASPWRTTK